MHSVLRSVTTSCDVTYFFTQDVNRAFLQRTHAIYYPCLLVTWVIGWTAAVLQWFCSSDPRFT